METTWSDWLWDTNRQKYYKSRLNAWGQPEYYYGEDVYQGDERTPRTSGNTEYLSGTGASQSPHDSRQIYDAALRAPHTESNVGNSSRTYTTASAPQALSFHQNYRQSQQPTSSYDTHQHGTSGSISVNQSQEENIPITENITEKDTKDNLEPGYEKQDTKKKIHAFFVPGRVFYVLWSEPAGQMPSESPAIGMKGAFSVVKHNELSYTEIRRFLVIKPHVYHSLCLPIATYRQYGTSRREDAKHHSIIYTGTEPNPLQGEDLDKIAISVEPYNNEKLDPRSRLNYSQTYTVQHNVKVKKLGKVPKEYMVYVKNYWKEALGLE